VAVEKMLPANVFGVTSEIKILVVGFLNSHQMFRLKAASSNTIFSSNVTFTLTLRETKGKEENGMQI